MIFASEWFSVNFLAQKFYGVGGDFGIQEVVILNESPHLKWETLSEKVPELPRGWFELSRVLPEERIEFVTDAWLARLPFHPKVYPSFLHFFSQIVDISVVVFKRELEYQVEMVYSLKEDRSFFRGLPPATEEDIRCFKQEVSQSLPSDYLSFLRLHNGFGKLSEMGLLSIEEIPFAKEEVADILLSRKKEISIEGKEIDPDTLIPFYEEFGMNSFQCFFSEWYPTWEMGNVYLSGLNETISNVMRRNRWMEEKAFPSFLEWLAVYIEGMNNSDLD